MSRIIKSTLWVFIIALLLPFSASAEHSWGNYHWARTTDSFDLTVINSTTADWDPYVTQATADWSTSIKLNLIEDMDGATSKRVRRGCSAPNGQIRICNLTYGQNGWLGIAGISVDSNGHITKGYTKLNDTYFNWSFYSDPNFDWKQSVTCQELGHNVGLGHQDEDFNNGSLFSCMDYQDPPYAYPNAHDYDQLATIYGHTDEYDSYSGGETGSGDTGGGCNSPKGKGCNKADLAQDNRNIGWGMSLGRRGQKETFMRIDPDGTRHMTFVTWAVGH